MASVQDGPDRVTAHFTDGSTTTADLLIGADGLNSTVRRTIAPATRPYYAGEYVFYGYTTNISPDEEADDERITLVRGRAAAFGYAVSPGGQTYWFARVAGERLAADEIAHGTPAQWRDLLLPLLREDATAAADIVAATTDDILVTKATEIPTGAPWRSGRMLLVGDAAHAASPATGQGASMAMEDAVILAKALRDTPGTDTDTALSVYETLRRPRVEHNITVSGNISRGAHTPSRTGQAPAARPGDEELARLLEWNSHIRMSQPGAAVPGGGS